ncbi:MAG: hypothetical protein ACTSWQ_03710 [Candidatus Thorarchaeota archaeon]
MKNLILGSVSALVGGVLVLLITKMKSFIDNPLLIVFMLFFVAMCGLGIGKVTSLVFDEEKPKKPKKKSKGKEKIGQDNGFIGDGRY